MREKSVRKGAGEGPGEGGGGKVAVRKDSD